ncbi:MAG: hypothetical protein PHV61_05430, partial [Limnochordia bacterium]|nr:hypothetical protein [Limnochordia bacterium]
ASTRVWLSATQFSPAELSPLAPTLAAIKVRFVAEDIDKARLRPKGKKSIKVNISNTIQTVGSILDSCPAYIDDQRCLFKPYAPH